MFHLPVQCPPIALQAVMDNSVSAPLAAIHWNALSSILSRRLLHLETYVPPDIPTRLQSPILAFV
jgi:hypothetical protein